VKTRNILNGLDGSLLQRDRAHLLEAGVMAGHAEDAKEAVEPVGRVCPNVSVSFKMIFLKNGSYGKFRRTKTFLIFSVG